MVSSGDFTLFDGGGVDGAGGGSDGPSGGGDRVVQRFWRSDYVDAFIAQATSAWNATEEEYDAPTTHYALTDRLFSVIAMLKHDGAIAERVRYTPYGQARHEWPHDVDGNGAAGGGAFAELNLVLSSFAGYGAGSYTPDADFDRDGVVTFTELNLVLGTSLPALTGGAISDRAGAANSVGYSGYQFDPAAGPEGLYLARHRWYDPALGTWVTRDPIGYADGMGLYEYVAGDPLWGIDPLGLKGRIDKDGSGGVWWDSSENQWLEIKHFYDNSGKYDPSRTIRRHHRVHPDYRGLDPRDLAGGPCSPEEAIREKIQSDKDMLDAAEQEIKDGVKEFYYPAAFIPLKGIPNGWQRMRPRGGRPTFRDPDGYWYQWDGQHGNWEKWSKNRKKHLGGFCADNPSKQLPGRPGMPRDDRRFPD